MTSHRLGISLEAKDLEPVLETVARWPAFDRMPVEMSDGDADWKPSRNWLEKLREAGEGYVRFTPIKPANKRAMVTISKGLVVGAHAPDMFSSVEDLVALLASIPFEVCSIGPVFPDEWSEIKSRPKCGFANTHEALGLGCAFRGAGHDRLVSRRWLEHGPWRLLHGPGDLSFVQFHDLGADPATALQQALPGHERMGMETGGFLQGPSAAGKGVGYVVARKLPEGLYDARSRTLEVVVASGRSISPGEMRDACAYRRQMRGDRRTPIDHVAYVFMTAAEARAHLDELWLRDLQVWTVERGDKRRLDLDHHPIPARPRWVGELEGG